VTGSSASAPTRTSTASTNGWRTASTRIPARASATASVAAGDLDGDGNEELVVAAGKGLPVKIFELNPDGTIGSLRESKVVFGPRGVFVAVGDLNADGRAELILGANSGVANIRIYSDTGFDLKVFDNQTARSRPGERRSRAACGSRHGTTSSSRCRAPCGRCVRRARARADGDVRDARAPDLDPGPGHNHLGHPRPGLGRADRGPDVAFNAFHSFDGDLDVTLTHVSTGTSLALFGDVGGTNEGFAIRLNDEAGTDIRTATNPKLDGPITGTFNPMGAAVLSIFDGQDASGLWRLNRHGRRGQRHRDAHVLVAARHLLGA
jgi:hypothetical protein